MPKQRLTDRQLISGVTLTDLLHFVVTGDTSQNPAGSSYKGNVEQLFGAFSAYTCSNPLTVDVVNACTSGITINGNVVINGSATTINTEVIQSKDNNIVLNYSGTHLTAIGGGITLEDGVSDGVDSRIFTNSDGIWLFDPGLSASTGTIDEFTACTSIHTSNLYGCSPIIVHDDIQMNSGKYIESLSGTPSLLMDYLSTPGSDGYVLLETSKGTTPISQQTSIYLESGGYSLYNNGDSFGNDGAYLEMDQTYQGGVTTLIQKVSGVSSNEELKVGMNDPESGSGLGGLHIVAQNTVNKTSDNVKSYGTFLSTRNSTFLSGTGTFNSVIVGGREHTVTNNNEYSVIIGGDGNYLDSVSNSVILGGNGLTGSTDNTVFVPTLNINALVFDASPVNVLGVDTNGNVVSTTVNGDNIYVTGGTYSTGTATFTNSTGGTFDVTGFTEGSGTLNYVTKWTPDGNTLGDSIIRDDGTNVGVSVSPFANVKLYVNGSGTQVGLWSRTSGNPTTLTYGSISENLNTSGTAYGIEGRAIQSGTGTRYGGYFRATSGTSNYSLLLQDGTEGAGKFLQCVTADGSANWVTLPEFTGNTSGDCITDLFVSNIHSCSPLNINPNDEGDINFGSTSGFTFDLTNKRFGISNISYGEPNATLNLRGAFDTRLSVQTQGSGALDNNINFDLYNATITRNNLLNFRRSGGSIESPSDYGVDGSSADVMSIQSQVYRDSAFRTIGSIDIDAEELSASTYNGKISFNTTNGTTSGERMLINSIGNVGINNENPQYKLDVTGEARLSGSGQNVLTVIGSGDTEPLFTVQGSSGELFSITDSLVGSLFSVNDISGLPILEVFDDDTVHMGSYQAPSLNTTVLLNPSTGLSTVYSIPMSAYTGAWFEYTVSNTGGARAGQIMSIFSGNTVNFTETTTTDIGSTSDVTFSMSADSTNTLLQVSATTSGWEVKTIVRSI